MISNALVDFINGHIDGYTITKGVNLFAEQGQGEQNIVVSVTSDIPMSANLTFVRQAPVNIMVKGWSAADGSIIADKICKRLEAMVGEYTYTVKSGVVETYFISGVSVRNWPTIIKRDGGFIFTANVEVAFKSL